MAVVAMTASGVLVFLARRMLTHFLTTSSERGIIWASLINDRMAASFCLSGLTQDKASICVITEMDGVWSIISPTKSKADFVKRPARKFDITLLSIKYPAIRYACVECGG